jgi:hypothetical protein
MLVQDEHRPGAFADDEVALPMTGLAAAFNGLGRSWIDARSLMVSREALARRGRRRLWRRVRYSPLHAAGAYQLRRRREAILEREAALRLFVRDRLAEGWTPEQISGWLKSGNEPRLRAIGCETIYAFIYRTGQKAEALWRYPPEGSAFRCSSLEIVVFARAPGQWLPSTAPRSGKMAIWSLSSSESCE